MGVETSENRELTCNICGRKFGKIQSLNIHRRYFHRIAKPKKISKPLKKRVKVDPVLVKKKINILKLTKITPLTMSPPKLRTNVATRSVNEISTEKIKAVTKPMFQCPKCFKLFNVYFSAYKHIQKNHCVDAKDQPVEPNSSQLIKPIRVDPCDICMTPKIDSHSCMALNFTRTGNTDIDNKDCCMCLGCQKTFNNLELFEEHVKQLHASKVDSYFFPNNSEYTAWKTELETLTKSKFTPRNSDTKAKPHHQIHHCSHKPTLEMTKTLLCPSFLRITEFKNGNLVFYYKQHFGHTCTEFSSSKYKKYCISPYLKDFVIKNIDNENSIYEQFKIITNNIINNCAQVDVSVLNTMFSKVLEMAIILNGSGQDSEQIAMKKNLTNDQITEVLAKVKTYPSRRKPDTSCKNDKNVTQENNENLKVNSPNIPVTTSGETLPSTQVNRSVLQSPPSFNDTYKDFVDQTIGKQILETTLPTPQKNAVKKKIVMKTKIGQFKPSLSPKETTTVPLPKISPKRKLSSPTTVPSKKPKPVVLTKTSGKAAISPQPKKDSSKTSKLTQETKTPLKTPLNTKTSKEKPMLSKKAETLKSKNFKVIPDIKYEVKEQENDCNILILKI